MKPNRIISTITLMTLCLSMVSQQSQAAQHSNRIFDLASTPASSRTAGTTQSIIEKLEQQFPSLTPQMKARAQFTTRKQSVGGQPGQLIVPVEEEVDSAAPAGLQPEEAEAWLAAFKSSRREQQSPLQLGYPARYDEVMVAEAHGVRAELRASRANAASIEIEDGKVVYREVYPGTDSVQVYRDGQSEEFLLLRDENAPVSFEYELKVSEGMQVLLEEGGVRLVNDEKQGLIIPKPWVVDAKGERRDDVVQWRLSEEWAGVRKLVLELSPAGLSYPIAIDPGWMATGNLNVGRNYHSATLLANGKVLVAGGYDYSGMYLYSTELYDPTTGAWTLTGNLNIGRVFHTATLLPNGKVLVAGGYFSLSCAELYDPATGTWSYTYNLNVARDHHTATLLANGKVLVTGGIHRDWIDNRSYANALSSAELYDPATGLWTTTGYLKTPRFEHTATLLANGRVLATAGGSISPAPNYLSSAELYDPATGVWTEMGNLNVARRCHTATLLANGKVLVAAGFKYSTPNPSSSNLNSAELYDPATGVSTITGDLNVARFSHTATLLANGKVLVTAGSTYNGWGTSYLSSAEVFDPATGVWTSAGNLNTVRVSHTATLLRNGNVLVAGGTSAELYGHPWAR